MVAMAVRETALWTLLLDVQRNDIKSFIWSTSAAARTAMRKHPELVGLSVTTGGKILGAQLAACRQLRNPVASK
eukprot:7988039-Heterocapsa_arctica.AAC.1